MRHPVDGKAWQKFDKRDPQFAGDVRNVRLGLAADGFNPLGNMKYEFVLQYVTCSANNLQSTSLDLYESRVLDVESLDSWATISREGHGRLFVDTN